MKELLEIKTVIIFLAIFFLPIASKATWSIVVLDSITNKIGMAGASCTHNVFGIGKYITNKGVLIAQAVSDRRCWIKGITMLDEGARGSDIMDTLTNPNFDPDFAFRQYALLSFSEFDKPITFSGDSITNFRIHAYTAPGISVQGNTLASELVLKKVFEAVVEARKNNISIEETLMLALEIGAKYGGDIRCEEQTATSAFIQVATPGDDRSCAYLDLRIVGAPKGGQNPIYLLREEYENVKSKLEKNKGTRVLIVPKE